MNLENRLENALRSPEPARALRLVVLELAQENHTKTAIYEVFERFLIHLRERMDYQESDEDTLLDVMDALTGWCHPDVQLLPEDTPAHRIERNG